MATTYYVATSGYDGNSGKSTSAPFRTIQHAANVVNPGDVVLIRNGNYRESIEAIRGGTASAPVTFQNYPNESPVILGSKVVTGWVSDGGAVWKKTGWTVNSQQVFYDFQASPKKSLQKIGMPSGWYTTWEYPTPVGSGRSTMKAGSFYWSGSSQTLYVWLPDGSNPNNHVMEASTQMRLFNMHQPYIRLKGLKFRHSNTSAYAQQGAAVELSSHSVADGIDVQHTDFAGISLGYQSDGAVVQNSISNNNGSVGIIASDSKNFRVSRSMMQFNNYRNFNTNWHAGGFKAANAAWGVVEYNEVGRNKGPGIWFDHVRTGNTLTVRNNFVHDNNPGEGAIFFEVSKSGLAYNNVVVNNHRRGIYLSGSDNSRVYNNTIYGTTGRAGIEVAGMPRSGATLTNNVLANNIVSYGTSEFDLYIMPPNGSSIYNNSSDYNNFYRSGGAPVQLRWANIYTSLSGFRSASGQDGHSKNVSPSFVAPGAATGFELKAGSLMIAGGRNLSSTFTTDYRQHARGTNYDIGAFEYQ
ncbi:MAG TPA: right-handed parallel beta-helix repeat-containing protein [Burkholderiales bacterium]|nr:right-handed parallel beta-helix repeat-containing protein [Burkholderiales bacterium]